MDFYVTYIFAINCDLFAISLAIISILERNIGKELAFLINVYVVNIIVDFEQVESVWAPSAMFLF